MGHWRDLLDKSHPVWTLAQTLASGALIYLAAAHGISGAHVGTVLDVTDAGGLAGVALAARVLWTSFLKR